MDFHCIAGDSEEENFRAVPALSRSKVLDIAAGAEHSAVITGIILQSCWLIPFSVALLTLFKFY